MNITKEFVENLLEKGEMLWKRTTDYSVITFTIKMGSTSYVLGKYECIIPEESTAWKVVMTKTIIIGMKRDLFGLQYDREETREDWILSKALAELVEKYIENLKM